MNYTTHKRGFVSNEFRNLIDESVFRMVYYDLILKNNRIFEIPGDELKVYLYIYIAIVGDIYSPKEDISVIDGDLDHTDEELAERVDMDLETFQRCIKELEEKGYIDIEKSEKGYYYSIAP